MYSVVLLTAMATTTTTPAFWHGGSGYGWYRGGYACGGYAWGGCHGCYGGSGYAPYSSYAGYDCYAPYSSYAGFLPGCWGYTPHYGCYGAGYGYHGGCYGAGAGYSVWQANPYMYGGCFGCHGGQSGYGIPLPVPDTRTKAAPADAFPPLLPVKKPATNPTEKEPEEVVVPKVKKLDDKKSEDKKIDKKVDDKQEEARVKVRIDIPEGGRLFVDGQRIDATGSRVFQTPPLTQGQKYFYNFRVEIDRDGQTVDETRRVIVELGNDVAVSFPSLTREAATAQVDD